MSRQLICGVPIDNLTMRQALDGVVAALEDSSPRQISFVNAHCVNVAGRSPEYARVLRRSALCLPDGIGVRIAARWHGWSVRENVNGTDMLPLLCNRLQAGRRSLYLLGGAPGVAAATARWMRVRCPGLRVAGWRDGYFGADEEDAVVGRIADSGADLLLVAMGVPRQELWLARHLPATGCRVGMGVGGLFDFYSGSISRAPRWMRRAGMEWLYRLRQEPARLFSRYVVGNPLFLARAAAGAMRARLSG